MNLEKEMSALEIKLLKDQMLENNSREDWVAEVVNLPNQIESLEKQFWMIGEKIVQARKILYIARLIGEEDE